jgi:hypothetical protein
VRRIVNYDRDVALGEAISQPLYNGYCGIGSVLDPENNLEVWIILTTAGGERFFQQRFVPAERL